MKQHDLHALLDQAHQYANEYIDHIDQRPVYPDEEALKALNDFEQAMPEEGTDPAEALKLLHQSGSPTTVAQTGGRYFGFVNGGIHPPALAAKWLADTWDQNAALRVMSPITAKLEDLCERWLVDLFKLPEGTAAGFVSGTSMSLMCGIAAGRNQLLERQDWDVVSQGLFGAPAAKVVLGEQAHSAVFKALSFIGLGRDRVALAPCDNQGRIIPEELPELDEHTLLILSAGNVNSGSFDPMQELCERSRKAGAWIHVDGAFGLWAAASPNTYPLYQGAELADSWSVDAHKTLNAPYDCGVILCKDRSALISALQASGAYLEWSEHRDGMLYTPEMSRRARAIELWMTLKTMGKDGVAELIDQLCLRAKQFAEGLEQNGFRILNAVNFNQVLVACENDSVTEATLAAIQQSGECWCGGSKWLGESVIRVSVCSHVTTDEDVEISIGAFLKARKSV
ncbi:MAG: aminotransferase class V-fold PLP-dependent enzyme [Arenicellales bacterium]